MTGILGGGPHPTYISQQFTTKLPFPQPGNFPKVQGTIQNLRVFLGCCRSSKRDPLGILSLMPPENTAYLGVLMTAGRLVHGFGCKAFWFIMCRCFLRIFGCHVGFLVSLEDLFAQIYYKVLLTSRMVPC